jgi:hypothetical protein
MNFSSSDALKPGPHLTKTRLSAQVEAQHVSAAVEGCNNKAVFSFRIVPNVVTSGW